MLFSVHSARITDMTLLQIPDIRLHEVAYTTRKLSYRRGDRAMHPMYMGALKIFCRA